MEPLPSKTEFEDAVLGAIFLDPAYAYTMCSERGVNEGWFFGPDARLVWTKIVHHAHEKSVLSLSPLAIGTELRDKIPDLYCDTCIDKCATVYHLEYFLDELEKLYDRRRGIGLCQTYEKVFREEGNPHATTSELASKCVEIGARKVKSVAEMQSEAVERAEKVLAGGQFGLSSSLFAVQERKSGYSPDEGECTIISARTSHGKTLLAMDETLSFIDQGAPCYWAEIDMSRESLYHRLAGRLAGVNTYLLTKTPRTDNEKARFRENLAEMKAGYSSIEKLPFFCDDFRMTIGEFLAKATNMVIKHGVRVIVLDHLTKLRMTRDEQRMGLRWAVGEWVARIQEFGIRHKVATFVLMQSNTRDSDKYAGKTPPLSGLGSLKESGSAEENADSVLIINKRPDMDVSEFGSNVEFWDMVINIAKNRLRGPTGLAYVKLWSWRQRFCSEALADEIIEQREEAKKPQEKVLTEGDPF